MTIDLSTADGAEKFDLCRVDRASLVSDRIVYLERPFVGIRGRAKRLSRRCIRFPESAIRRRMERR
jgi:hypothetical protein